MRWVHKALAAVYFSIAIWMFIISVSTVLAQSSRDYAAELAAEHRITTIETQLAETLATLRELKQRGEWDWLKSLAMIVLVGDAGVRQMKKKSKLIITPDDE